MDSSNIYASDNLVVMNYFSLLSNRYIYKGNLMYHIAVC
jgi:hypothetical protein